MKLSRPDLDGLGSPAEIAARVHELEPGLTPGFAFDKLCRKLDIREITDMATNAFEAALLMHPDKAFGSIVLAKGRSDERRRLSIGHELGHFLIPTHMPRPGETFECSLTDLHLTDTREKDRRRRIEAEANRFAAALLMPPRAVRQAMTARHPDLAEVLRLAREFGVSKEAMARGYIEAQHKTIESGSLCTGSVTSTCPCCEVFTPRLTFVRGDEMLRCSMCARGDVDDSAADTIMHPERRQAWVMRHLVRAFMTLATNAIRAAWGSSPISRGHAATG